MSCYQRLSMSPTKSIMLLLYFSLKPSADVIQGKMSHCFAGKYFPEYLNEIAGLFQVGLFMGGS